jgi:polysaccharide export outer membrane protein
MVRQTLYLMTLSLTFLFISARAQDQAGNKQIVAPHGAESPSKPATEDPNYMIGAQDVLEISVWKEPELSHVVPVRPDGKISLPLLNDMQAAGLTPLELTGRITAGLSKFMTNPQVTVMVSQINSQRIYILGEVGRPGAFPLLPGMTLLQAISDAGGPTPFAHSKKIYLLRERGGKQEKIFFNYKEVLDGKRPEQNVDLRAGDTIVVP